MRKLQVSSGFACILFILAMVLGCNKQNQGSTPAPAPTPAVETPGGDQPPAVTTSTVPTNPQEMVTTATQPVEPQKVTTETTETSITSPAQPQEVSVEPGIPNAKFVYKKSEITQYKAPIKLIHTMFEANGPVTNLSLVFECTGDTDTQYRAEFQLVKGKAIKYGLGPRMLAKAEGGTLKPGDRVTVKVLTQIPQVFAPEEVTGVRIFLKDVKTSYLAPIEKTGLDLEKGNVSVVWTFDPSIQPSVTPADEKTAQPASESVGAPADKKPAQAAVKKKTGKNAKKRSSKPSNE